METAKVFMTGRSQAVRLPKEYRFEGTEVLIKRVGRAVVLMSREHGWDTLFESLNEFEPGLQLARDQPKKQQRRTQLR